MSEPAGAPGPESIVTILSQAEQLMLRPTPRNAEAACEMLARAAAEMNAWAGSEQNEGLRQTLAVHARGSVSQIRRLFDSAWQTQLACYRISQAGAGGYLADSSAVENTAPQHTVVVAG